MKYILILLLSSLAITAQETKFYLQKRDTLFIFIDENVRKNYIKKRYENIDIVKEKKAGQNKESMLKTVGLKTIYIFTNDTIEKYNTFFKNETNEQKKAKVTKMLDEKLKQKDQTYIQGLFTGLYKFTRIDANEEYVSKNNKIAELPESYRAYKEFRKEFETTNNAKP